MSDCWGFYSEFDTLKECFDYVAWLQSQNDVEPHISTTIGNAFREYLQKARGSSLNITNLLNALVELRNVIVKNANNYGVFRNKGFGENCDGGHIYNVSISLCRIYGALLFLYFNITETEKDRGGGGWSELSCNDSNSEFCKWLTRPPNPGSGLLSGGFSINDLNSTSGNQIVSQIGTQLSSTGGLCWFLRAALFLPPWLHEKTAAACLLVKQLCDEIRNGGMTNKIPGEYADGYDAIKRICTKLLEAFAKLIKENNNGFLSVTHNGSTGMSPYNVEENFRECFGYVRTQLPDVIASLEHMKGQCASWTAEKIKNAQTPGPFLYGFTFTDSCNPSTIEQQGRSELTQAIEDVLRDLNELNEILNPTSHAVAIGLGVASSLLVGGSAATAYFYPGLLSSNINMVVG
ncbi:secreted antigen 1 [Babesia caballi]|uniref:Secreted antigen 1 n=1 Tax=Babesia caballi TaxID=5871 RepID=A0AAV4LLH9_BABCB|nr:secreted antigen 1 [Babesia caballi]